MEIELLPLEKIIIDGKEICLNADKMTVEALIGAGENMGNRHYYYDSEMAIDYNDDGMVEFIEFLGGSDGLLKPLIYGVSAFDIQADELITLLTEKNHGRIDDTEDGYSYGFLELSVGIYRELRPCDIEEMKADGVPVDDNEGLEQDKTRANHWQTIGIGVAGYYN